MAQRHAARGRIRRGDKSRDKWHELALLFDECVRFYLRLTALAAKMYRKGPLSGPRRTILAGLDRSGPRTVAQMARERMQSRQRFQPLVNALVAEGLLEAVPNAAHKQSPLIALTARGRKAVQHIRETEERWRSRLNLRTPADKLAQTTAVLQELRIELERVLADRPSYRKPSRRRSTKRAPGPPARV